MLDRQEKINVLAKHFENFNDRVRTDPLFGVIISNLVDDKEDVYSVINLLLKENQQLLQLIGMNNDER